jgi:hypothetical protein
MAIVDTCSEKYEECITKCKNNACEDVCQKNLMKCEKDIPAELKTLK